VSGITRLAFEALNPYAAIDRLSLAAGNQTPEITSVTAKLPDRAATRTVLSVVYISVRRIMKNLFVGYKLK
jgi:hypothetical protein